MATFTPFDAHLKAVYDRFWNTADSARLILLSNTVSATSDLSTVLGLEVASGNGYSTGGASLDIHASTVDPAQLRTEGRPDPVTFTASGGAIEFTGFAVIATRSSVDELCLFYNYPSAQTIADGSSREITLEINLGRASANVEAS